jgi:hypothetical protein
MAEFSAHISETELQTKRTTKLRFRASIFDAWDHQCAYCNQPADTLDHVVPRSAGGLTVAGNLVPACQRCNGLKQSTTWREWFAAQSWFCPDRATRIDGWLNPPTTHAA